MKILITEIMWENGIHIFQEAGWTVHYEPEIGRNREQLENVVSEYDALIIRNETIVDKNLLNKAERLKVIGRLGVGLDNIDLEAVRERSIGVVVPKNANAASVAEYVMGAILDASRNISEAAKHVRQGYWDRKRFTGKEISGKTLGLIGLGEISNRIAKRANAFGMKIIGFDPFISKYDYVVSENSVELVDSIEELLPVSDFVSIHVPLTNGTRNMFNWETFSMMKNSAYLINSSRGGIVNELDLIEAIKNEKIRGAYLDVLESEPVQPDSPLLNIEQICITPHVAGLTDESQERISNLVALEVMKVLKGNYSNCVI